MTRLIVSLTYLAVSFVAAVVGVYFHVWQAVFVTVVLGLGAVGFAVLYGKDQGRAKFEGQPISEEDLPREVYRVIGITKHRGCDVVVICNGKDKVITCRSDSSKKSFIYFSIKGDEEYGKYFVPNTLEGTTTPKLMET